jgi:2-deoxy-D-gluconate 3-dehydrogenase
MSEPFEKRFRLDGKVALVTGGGMGIGKAVCLTLSEAGAAVVVQDIDPSLAESVAAEIRSTGAKAVAVAGDITDTATITTMLARARDEFGRLDVLVNNAGIYPFVGFLEMPVETLDRVLNVNLRAVFICTQMGGQMMADLGNGGSVINLASVQGFRPGNPGVSHYDTTKAGVIMLTKAAALELAPHNIRVNAVAPGMTDTPGTRKVFQPTAALGIPLRRLGEPSDVANLILFLVSPAAAYITGETVVVDGGMLLK